MTINEMMKNPELLVDITEDLEDFDETTEVVYEVWALGYDENDEITDAELCMFTPTLYILHKKIASFLFNFNPCFSPRYLQITGFSV